MLLAVSVPALLPVSRLVELPLLIMAVIGLYDLARGSRPRGLKWFVLLFGCYWIPQFLSSLDSMDPGKSWATVAAQLRFVPAGAFLFTRIDDSQRRILVWLAGALILWWTLDALIQALFGVNTLAMPRSEERLNGVFGENNIKLGHVLAALSPLTLEWLRRHGGLWIAMGFTLLATVILLIGTRSAWIMFAVVSVCYLYIFWRESGWSWLKYTAAMMLLVGLTATVSYHASDQFRERVDRSLHVLDGDSEAVNYALSRRLPIWKTAISMGQAHWINGVGTRAFRNAYPIYAAPDDPWAADGSGAHHAHQIFLEALTETGVIGIAGWCIGLLIAVRWWTRATFERRSAALPFAIALLSMLFPINTHLAFFSTFWSIVFWWLVALFVHALAAEDNGGTPVA